MSALLKIVKLRKCGPCMPLIVGSLAVGLFLISQVWPEGFVVRVRELVHGRGHRGNYGGYATSSRAYVKPMKEPSFLPNEPKGLEHL